MKNILVLILLVSSGFGYGDEYEANLSLLNVVSQGAKERINIKYNECMQGHNIKNNDKRDECQKVAEEYCFEKGDCSQISKAMIQGDNQYANSADRIVIVNPEIDDVFTFAPEDKCKMNFNELIKKDATTHVKDGLYISEGACRKAINNRFFIESDNQVSDPSIICRDILEESKDVTNTEEAFSSYLESPKAKENAKKLVSGCFALKKLKSKIEHSSNLDLDDGETSYQSIDSAIKCNLYASMGEIQGNIPAIDYFSCRKSAYWYNTTFLTSDVIKPIGSQIFEAYKSADIDGKMIEKQAGGGVDAQTAALEAQQKKYKLKSDSEKGSAALETGKAMAMFGNMMAYMTPKYFSENYCENRTEDMFDMSQDDYCRINHMARYNTNIGAQLMNNQGVKGQMLTVGALALSKAVVHAIVADTYRKQANLVGDVKDEFANADFNNPDNVIKWDETFCGKNPMDKSCNPTTGRVGTGSGVDFNFGGGTPTNGTTIETGGINTDTTGNGITSNTLSDDEAEDLGNILGGGGGSKSDNSFNAPGAASAGAAKVGGASGGGGGGGSGAGGGGGGEGAAKAAALDGGAGGKVKVAYSKGGNFTSGGSSSSPKKSNDPFKDFGKSSSRNLASEVEKFIHPKKSQLFETISKRYGAVSSTDRLHKITE